MNRAIPLNLYSVYRSRFASIHSELLTTEFGVTYTYGDAEHYSAQIANYLIHDPHVTLLRGLAGLCRGVPTYNV